MEKIRFIHFAGGASEDLIVELTVLNRDAKGEQLGFVIYDRLNDKLSVESFIIGPDNERYMPIEKPPWLVPDKIEDLTLNEEELYNELIDFLKAHLDLLEEVEYYEVREEVDENDNPIKVLYIWLKPVKI